MMLSASVASHFVSLPVISPEARSPFLRLIKSAKPAEVPGHEHTGGLAGPGESCWISGFTKGASVWLFADSLCLQCHDLSSSAISDVCLRNAATSL